MPEHTIAENLARLQAAKTAIGNAIVAKGGTVNLGDGLEEYPTDIASIETAELTSISITENGVYSSGDTEEVESSNLPIVIEADGTPLSDFLISGNMSQTGTPTPASPIQPSECGELETIGAKAGQYKISISSNNTTTPVYLGEVRTTRKIKNHVFTGQESDLRMQSAITATNAVQFPTTTSDYKREPFICSHMEVTNSSSGSSTHGFYGQLLTLCFALSMGLDTIEKVRTYLQQQYANGTPVTVWYVLAEPTTGIVNEPLRKIGNYADTLSMEQAGVQIPTNTSPSTTTIDIPTTLPPSLLYVQYNTLSTTSGYNIVDVNVPNTYSSSDEGKVVSNGSLIPQTSSLTTINGTIDTTLINSLEVAVSDAFQLDIHLKPLSKKYKSATKWVAKTWDGLTTQQLSVFTGEHIWTDGENIYYSYSSTNLVLDKETSTWNRKTWNGFTGLNGQDVWTDGENIYYSDSTNQYVLDKETSTWNTKTWSGFSSGMSGRYIWTDGENIYYSWSGIHKVLDKETSTWNTKTWNGSTSFTQESVWTDGENIYYSNGSTYNQYILNKSTSTWSRKTWSGGPSSMSGVFFWTDGMRIFYSSGSSSYLYDKTTSSFSSYNFATFNSVKARCTWSDGENIYYSDGSNQYVLETEKVENYFSSLSTRLK